MEEQKSVSKSVVTTAISAFAVMATLTGGGVAWWMTHDRPQTNTASTITSTGTSTVKPPQVNISPATVTPIVTASKLPIQAAPASPAPIPSIAQNPANVAPAAEDKVKVFWIDDKDNKKSSVSSQERKIASTVPKTQEGYAKESLTILLASAGKEGKQTSTIPAGTKLLSSAIKADGLHIDLSKEFTQGGGSTSMQGRIAQVLYTATSRNPDMPVWIDVEGKPLEALGGEGVEIKQPLTRKVFQQEFKDSVGE
jgi:spore germination protein GerM